MATTYPVGRLPLLSWERPSLPDRCWPGRQPKWDSSPCRWTPWSCCGSGSLCPLAGPPQVLSSYQVSQSVSSSKLETQTTRVLFIYMYLTSVFLCSPKYTARRKLAWTEVISYSDCTGSWVILVLASYPLWPQSPCPNTPHPISQKILNTL